MQDPNSSNIKIKKVVYNKYSLARKSSVIFEVEKTSIHSASAKYGMDRKCIKDWISHKEDMINIESTNKKYMINKNARFSL